MKAHNLGRRLRASLRRYDFPAPDLLPRVRKSRLNDVELHFTADLLSPFMKEQGGWSDGNVLDMRWIEGSTDLDFSTWQTILNLAPRNVQVDECPF